MKFANHKYDMISDLHKRLFTRIAILKNFKSQKNVIESSFKSKTFKSLKEVMESFSNAKNFKSRKKVTKSFFSIKNFKSQGSGGVLFEF